MNTLIDCYAVFGNPIAHSKSPILHTAFAEQTKESISYTAHCIDSADFVNAVTTFFKSGGLGLNITVPFKIDAFNIANQLTSRARRAGAVNTLSKHNNDEILGDNTDGIGLVNDIKRNANWTIKDKKILILGAGGAVRGILEPLILECPQSITIANRTLSKANQLADNFFDLYNIKVLPFNELTHQYDLVINGTSSSLSGNTPPIPQGIITEETCCYDMVYSKELTPFLAYSKQQGSKNIRDGLGMLVCQGAESFFIWRNKKPDTATIITQLRSII